MSSLVDTLGLFMVYVFEDFRGNKKSLFVFRRWAVSISTNLMIKLLFRVFIVLVEKSRHKSCNFIAR
jgi:hypothetical protein